MYHTKTKYVLNLILLLIRCEVESILIKKYSYSIIRPLQGLVDFKLKCAS